MHRRRLIALDEMRFVAVSDQQRVEFVVRNAREDRGIRDLIAIEVQPRQDGASRMGLRNLFSANLHANGGLLRKELDLPDFRCCPFPCTRAHVRCRDSCAGNSVCE
jgi:hypothetical protein